MGSWTFSYLFNGSIHWVLWGLYEILYHRHHSGVCELYYYCTNPGATQLIYCPAPWPLQVLLPGSQVCPGPGFTSGSPYVTSLPQLRLVAAPWEAMLRRMFKASRQVHQSISNVQGGCRTEEWTHRPRQANRRTHTHTSCLHKAVKEIWPLFLSTFQPFSYYQLVLSNLFWGLASLLSPRDICVHEGLLENRKPFKISQNESLTVNH